MALAGCAVAVTLLALAVVQGNGHGRDGVAWASQELLPQLVPFVLYDRGLALHVTADAATVGDALDRLQVQLHEADLVSPPRDAPLTPGLRVVVRRAKHVLLQVDGGESWVATHATSVGDLLAERGVFLGELDRVSPGPHTRLSNGMSVRVVRVRVTREVQEEILARNVVYRDDPSLLQGQGYVAQEGSDGVVRREYEVVYEDGREAARRLVAENTIPAQDRVVVRGTRRPPPPSIAVPAGGGGDCSGVSYSRTMTVYATWYGPGRGAGYYTATGLRLGYGIVAVDPSVIPLGTRLCVPGYGMAVAADTGGAVRGYMIDLAYPEGVVPNWRTGYVTIYILD